MLDKLQNSSALAGRLLIALLFLPAGITKFGDIAGTAGYIASAGLPVPQLGAIAAAAVETLGAVAVIVGVGTRAAALLLALFTVVASFLFHAYWAAPADQQFLQQLMFFKNIAVVGGLLLLAAWGPGAWSLDARAAR